MNMKELIKPLLCSWYVHVNAIIYNPDEVKELEDNYRLAVKVLIDMSLGKYYSKGNIQDVVEILIDKTRNELLDFCAEDKDYTIGFKE